MKPLPQLLKSFTYQLPGYLMILGFLFGLFVVLIAPYEMVKMAQTESWPSRKGVVTVAYDRHYRGARQAESVSSEICGTYHDNGERFCVARIRYGSVRWGTGEASALAAVSRYPVGSEIEVFHAPGNLKDTVLEPRPSWREMQVMLGLGLFFLALPVLLHVLKKKGVLK